MTAPSDATTTDAEATTDQADEDVPGDTETEDQADVADGDGDDENPNAEAAKWRRQFRAAQADLAAMTTRLEAQQQSFVDGIASSRGVDPRLLTAAGHTLDTLLNEHGELDQAKVAEVCDQVAREFRLSRGPTPNPQQGAISHDGGGASWAAAIRGG